MASDTIPVPRDDTRRPAPALQCLDGGWTDEAVVAGAQQQDPAAVQALFDAHIDRIEGLVWRLLGPDSEHDDVVSQVLLNIARSLHTIRDPSALRSWLTGLTINTVKKELTRRQRRPVLRLGEPVPEIPDDSPGPGDLAVARGLYRVLGQLEPDHRILLILRYVEGLTLPEISKATARSLATTKRHLGKARECFADLARQDFWLSERMGGDE